MSGWGGGAHGSEALLDVLAIGKGAALTAQQQLVKELHVDEAEELQEELAAQEQRHLVRLQMLVQPLQGAKQRLPARRAYGPRRLGSRGVHATRRLYAELHTAAHVTVRTAGCSTDIMS